MSRCSTILVALILTSVSVVLEANTPIPAPISRTRKLATPLPRLEVPTIRRLPVPR